MSKSKKKIKYSRKAPKKMVMDKDGDEMIPKYGDGGAFNAALPGILTAAGGIATEIVAPGNPMGIGMIASGAGSAISNVSDYNKEQKLLSQQSIDTNQAQIYQQPAYFKMGGVINGPGSGYMVDHKYIGQSHGGKNGGIMQYSKGNPFLVEGGERRYKKDGMPDLVMPKNSPDQVGQDGEWTRNGVLGNQKVRDNKEMISNTEAFKRGGKLNFKSVDSYHNWLGYIQATGVAGRTPGHQRISIGGKSHKVNHMKDGGIFKDPNQTNYIDPETGRPFVYNNQEQTPYQQPDFMGDIYNNAKIVQNSPQQLTNKNKLSSLEGNYSDTPLAKQQFASGKNYSFGNGMNLGVSGPTGSPAPKPFAPNWQSGLNTAATWAPVVYNTITGLSKTNTVAPKTNAYEAEANKLLNRRMDPSFAIRQNRLTGIQNRKALSQTGMSQGTYLGLANQNDANTQNQQADIINKYDTANIGLDFSAAQSKYGFGQGRINNENYADSLNTAMKVNKAQYIPKALEEASFLTQKTEQAKRTSAAYNKYYQALAEIDSNPQYDTPEKKKEAKDKLQYNMNYAYQQPWNNSGYDNYFPKP